MTACRICLSKKPDKDILELQVNEKRDVKSFTEVIMFCLDIQVSKHLVCSWKMMTIIKKLASVYYWHTYSQ